MRRFGSVASLSTAENEQNILIIVDIQDYIYKYLCSHTRTHYIAQRDGHDETLFLRSRICNK